MHRSTLVEHLFAGKPTPFGPQQSPSSIIKMPFTSLDITFNGATQDEQGNKKLHGGPYMALHQYAQESYALLAGEFPSISNQLSLGSIGENISSPTMNESNVFIGDEYKVGSAILRVVSPRAPCSKINHRYGLRKIDLFVAEHAITGWYYSVVQEGNVAVGDEIALQNRQTSPISVKQIWQLRQQVIPSENPHEAYKLASLAFQNEHLAPPWQAYMHRVSVKLAKYC